MDEYKTKDFPVNEVIQSSIDSSLLENDTADCLLTPFSSNQDRANRLTESEGSNPSFKDAFKQISVCCVMSFTVLQAGLIMSYSSVLIEQLDVDMNYDLSKEDSSWIASLSVLTTPIGSLVCGPVMDKVGRKPGILIACALSFIGWILILFVTPQFYLPLILMARILGGLGGGMTTIALIYIPEVCHEKYRPLMLGTNSMLVSLGILFVTVTCYFTRWRMMAFEFCLIILVNMIVIWLYMPESPVWQLTMKRDRQLAESTLRWLNPNEKVFDTQLLTLNKLARSRTDCLTDDSSPYLTQKLKSLFHTFFSPPAKQPLLILIGIMTLQQFCGGYTIVVYTIQVFKKLGTDFGEGIDEYTALLFMGILRFVFSVVTAVISQFIGRRPLLISSAIGMALSSIAIPLHHYIDTNYPSKLSEMQWPVIFALMFVSFTALGIMNIPWSMIGELLPMNVRGTASGFLVALAYTIMFFVVKIYPYLLDEINIDVLFLAQGLLCILTAFYVHIFVPETLGKSLHSIQEHFYRRKEKPYQG
ncbi:facilitated trehalose transporter Tret1-2 homolog [Nilaparvata lugens]|uniref:facilitated trehalose transporter Tret1-2 homolog n=1 Tax=Nilaparvata lugens TaxID=108931 RepID=UPI00193EACB4|nr:facilitated trehalose transporter Tret1-2 homolog [Nilaparvata lugens]XP_039284440.1 facilitated trehalose transporter Tret1-2 homolog [Nilaparvata lugens]XP_039284449.1 facilitated trehalose transporter Tret1-2 homolog [Nilaparvata lugens]